MAVCALEPGCWCCCKALQVAKRVVADVYGSRFAHKDIFVMWGPVLGSLQSGKSSSFETLETDPSCSEAPDMLSEDKGPGQGRTGELCKLSFTCLCHIRELTKALA